MINRRKFIKSTCLACAATTLGAALLSGCSSTRYVNGTLGPEGITLLPSDFLSQKGDGNFLPYIVVRNEKVEFPICVYRFSESDYSALLMKCTHQGNELQVAGDHLHCSAHGSEFNNKGMVAQGPAETNLRSFNVIPGTDKVLIQLK